MPDTKGINQKKLATKQRAVELLQQNRSSEAVQTIAGFCKQNPGDAEALLICAIARSKTGDLANAEQDCRQAIIIAPGNAGGHLILGEILQAQGKLQHAATAYLEALNKNPQFPQALNNLGSLQRITGHLDEAEQYFKRALSLSVNNPVILTNLGLLEKDRNNLPGAIDLQKQALLHKPDYSDAHFNLANALQLQGNSNDAETHYRKALEHNPNSFLALHGLGQLLASRGETHLALSLLEQASAIQPGFPDIPASIAEIYEKQGNHEKALQVIAPYITSGASPGISLSFAKIAPHLNREDDAISLLTGQLTNPVLPISIKKDIHFALGDLFDSKALYQQAFEYYQLGNKNTAKTTSDPGGINQIHLIKETFQKDNSKNITRSSNASDKPIFIVGMPRSGTTLIEQIIACHPSIAGAGELPYLGDILNSFPARFGQSTHYPTSIDKLSKSDLDTLALNYLEKLSALAPDATRISDKMPHNFLHIGIIDRLFPKARIIHCMRNPMDTCVSIYFHNFSTNHPYASDLKALGTYYNAYKDLMEHWLKVIDMPILNVSYEGLVAEQETISRQIIEFCGVDWNDNCLRFYESERIANTPSYNQVREPLYSKSVDRWKHYSKELQPLKQALK